MSTLTLHRHVDLGNYIFRYIAVELEGHNSVHVHLWNSDNVGEHYNETHAVFPWEKITDVEHMSIQFETEQVRVFKEIVKMLGIVHAHAAEFTTWCKEK